MIKDILKKERNKLSIKKEALLKKLAIIESEINEIDNFVKEEVKEEIKPQTVIVCIYERTRDNAPQNDEYIWYPVFGNPNTTDDITELLKTHKVLIGDDSENLKDKAFLRELSEHFKIEFLGE